MDTQFVLAFALAAVAVANMEAVERGDSNLDQMNESVMLVIAAMSDDDEPGRRGRARLVAVERSALIGREFADCRAYFAPVRGLPPAITDWPRFCIVPHE